MKFLIVLCISILNYGANCHVSWEKTEKLKLLPFDCFNQSNVFYPLDHSNLVNPLRINSIIEIPTTNKHFFKLDNAPNLEQKSSKTLSLTAKNLKAYDENNLLHLESMFFPMIAFLQDQIIFKETDKTEFEFEEPKSSKKGSIYHIKTYFGKKLTEEELRQKADQFLKSLIDFAKKNDVFNTETQIFLNLISFEDKNHLYGFFNFIAIFVPRKDIPFAKVVSKSQNNASSLEEKEIKAYDWHKVPQTDLHKTVNLSKAPEDLNELLKKKYKIDDVVFLSQSPSTNLNAVLYAQYQNMDENLKKLQSLIINSKNTGRVYWDNVYPHEQLFYVENFVYDEKTNLEAIADTFMKNFHKQIDNFYLTIPFDEREKTSVSYQMTPSLIQVETEKYINIVGTLTISNIQSKIDGEPKNDITRQLDKLTINQIPHLKVANNDDLQANHIPHLNIKNSQDSKASHNQAAKASNSQGVNAGKK